LESLNEKVLETVDIHVRFDLGTNKIHAVNGASFSIFKGESMGLVGESGCGKSTMANAILGILPKTGDVVKGKVLFKGVDLVQNKRAAKQLWGKEMFLIPQDPSAALDPCYSIKNQLAETLRHRGKNALEITPADMLREIGIGSPERRQHDYPFQMSGGMKQRVIIAMALAYHPSLLIADEPTSSLDVTIQDQILKLLRRLQRLERLSLLLITHDMGIIAKICDRVSVMYAGQIMETGITDVILSQPAHPYTQALLASLPQVDRDVEKLVSIPGEPPGLQNVLAGCPFAPRCNQAKQVCFCKKPTQIRISAEHQVACHLVR